MACASSWRPAELFLLGLLFGDITGSGAIVFGRRCLSTALLARAEAAADAFGAQLMLRLGRSPKRSDLPEPHRCRRGEALCFISSHPVTAERVRALEAADRPVTGPPLWMRKNGRR